MCPLHLVWWSFVIVVSLHFIIFIINTAYILLSLRFLLSCDHAKILHGLNIIGRFIVFHHLGKGFAAVVAVSSLSAHEFSHTISPDIRLWSIDGLKDLLENFVQQLVPDIIE